MVPIRSAPISIHRGNAPKPVPKNQKLNARISNDGRYAWIGDQLGSAFSVIDLHTRALSAVIPAGRGRHFHGAAHRPVRR